LVEQSDPAMKNAYRDSAIKNMNEYNRSKFDKAFY
jgi:hypothetical protein